MTADTGNVNWEQALAVVDASNMRIESDAELSLDFQTRALVRAYNEAQETETLLRGQMQELDRENKAYADLFNQLLKAVPPGGDPDFWGQVRLIINRPQRSPGSNP
jgi:hypothetical protein